jgi:hypothetical protein
MLTISVCTQLLLLALCVVCGCCGAVTCFTSALAAVQQNTAPALQQANEIEHIVLLC